MFACWTEPHEVVLTDAGQQLALRLERLLDELNSTLRDTGRMGQQLSGKVRVAASQTISAHLIPQSNALLKAIAISDIRFVLHDRPQQWVMESIRQEMSILASSSIWPSGRSAMCEAILSEPFFLLCHRDSAGRGRLCPLAGITGSEIGVAGLRVRQPALIDAALARNGIQANIVQEIGHPATLFPMVAAGIGISILPALALPLPEGSPLVVSALRQWLSAS